MLWEKEKKVTGLGVPREVGKEGGPKEMACGQNPKHSLLEEVKNQAIPMCAERLEVLRSRAMIYFSAWPQCLTQCLQEAIQ